MKGDIRTQSFEGVKPEPGPEAEKDDGTKDAHGDQGAGDGRERDSERPASLFRNAKVSSSGQQSEEDDGKDRKGSIEFCE